jgi:hypothetical protein
MRFEGENGFKQGHITLYIDRGAITAEYAHLPHTERPNKIDQHYLSLVCSTDMEQPYPLRLSVLQFVEAQTNTSTIHLTTEKW